MKISCLTNVNFALVDDLDHIGYHKGWFRGMFDPSPIFHWRWLTIKFELYIIPFQIQNDELYSFLWLLKAP